MLIICIQVIDDDFEILLLYLDGFKGKLREVIVKQVEDIMEKDEDSEGELLIMDLVYGICMYFGVIL